MTTLAATIDFSSGGNSDGAVLEGWAEPEAVHRWTLGRESRVALPIARPGPGCVLVVDATPCLHPPDLVAQTVMLAINGRLVATVQLAGLQIMAFPFPRGVDDAREVVLSFSHLSAGHPRPPAQMRHGQPLGLMVHSVRVFRLSPAEQADSAGTLPGLPPGPSLPDEVRRRTGLAVQALAERFESIGQGCQFGLVQRQCGAEPLALLRFVDTVTSRLAQGLVSGFAGVERPERLGVEPTGDTPPRLRCRQQDYGLAYDTLIPAQGADPAVVRDRQARRLGFLRSKFVEDRAACSKICVLTRGDRLSHSEAFAVYCALRLSGPNTLLWTVMGDEANTGRVDRLAPGFLRGQLGRVDSHAYGAPDAWLSIMANAVLLDVSGEDGLRDG